MKLYPLTLKNFRGYNIETILLNQHIIDYAKEELKNIDIHLTSSPHRVAANYLY